MGGSERNFHRCELTHAAVEIVGQDCPVCTTLVVTSDWKSDRWYIIRR